MQKNKVTMAISHLQINKLEFPTTITFQQCNLHCRTACSKLATFAYNCMTKPRAAAQQYKLAVDR